MKTEKEILDYQKQLLKQQMELIQEQKKEIGAKTRSKYLLLRKKIKNYDSVIELLNWVLGHQ